MRHSNRLPAWEGTKGPKIERQIILLNVLCSILLLFTVTRVFLWTACLMPACKPNFLQDNNNKVEVKVKVVVKRLYLLTHIQNYFHIILYFMLFSKSDTNLPVDQNGKEPTGAHTRTRCEQNMTYIQRCSCLSVKWIQTDVRSSPFPPLTQQQVSSTGLKFSPTSVSPVLICLPLLTDAVAGQQLTSAGVN